jgi:hypothetical protein
LTKAARRNPKPVNLNVAKDIWKTYTTDIKHTARHIIDDLEFDTSVIANNFTELIESEINRIGRNIDSDTVIPRMPTSV